MELENDQGILMIEWKVEDIIEAMKEMDVEPTEEKLLQFLKSENIRMLEEKSIAVGWEVIYSILKNQREDIC